MQNTYSKISQITSQQITERLKASDKRVRLAASEMSGIYHRRENAVVQVPSDCRLVALPDLSDLPAEISAATSPQRINSWHSRYNSAKSAIHRDSMFNGDDVCYPLVQDDAAPAQIVAAIHAADAYAASVEEVAATYRTACEQAITTHVASQVAAVNELAGLVAQI
jgi:hypothetical protein